MISDRQTAHEYAATHTDAELRRVLVSERGYFTALMGAKAVDLIEQVTVDRRRMLALERDPGMLMPSWPTVPDSPVG